MFQGMMKSVAARTAAALGLMAVLCFGGAAWLIERKAAEEQRTTALRELEQLARSEAAHVRGTVTESLVMVRGLAASTMGMIEGPNPDRAAASDLVRRYAAADPSALGYWLEFEPGAFDGRDAGLRRAWPGGKPSEERVTRAVAAMSPGERVTTDSGRLSIYWVLDESAKPSLVNAVGPAMDKNLYGEGEEYYAAARKRGAELMYEPYTYDVNGAQVLMTSVEMPLSRNGRHIGVAGADITLKKIQADLARVRPYGTGVVRLLSPKGLVLAAPEAKLLGKQWPRPLGKVMSELAAGRAVYAEEPDAVIGGQAYRVYVPVTAGRGRDVFVLVVSAPVDAVMAGVREVRNRVLWAGLLSVGLLVALVVVLLRRKVGMPLQGIVHAVDAVAAGRLDYPIPAGGDDEVGHVSRALRRMQADLKQRIEAERAIAAENLRVRIALDNAGTAMLIAAADGHIVYANPAMRALLAQHAAELRRVLPGLDPEQPEGLPLSSMQPGDAAAAVTDVQQRELTFGRVVIAQTLAPVVSPEGERLGVVVEWRDRTQEVAVEAEVAEVIEAAAAGDLGKRIAIAGKTGFFRRLAEGVDTMLDANAESITAVQHVLAALAQGDLTQRIDADFGGVFGQMRDDTNATVDRLAEILQRVSATVEAINTAAGEITAGNLDLSARSEQQAASLEETASTMAQLTTTVHQNADASRKARELAAGAAGIAARGGQVMTDVVGQMGGITDASRKIESIIGVIDEIAFQTNILALNASVEAARAGEHGRGFAVVATEVRMLAQRSAKAAKEIKVLIAESGERVGNGAALVAQAGATMDEILGAVKRVTDLMGEIAAASKEQAAGITQVNDTITRMDGATQQNVALVEEATAAARALAGQASDLADAVSVFRLD